MTGPEVSPTSQDETDRLAASARRAFWLRALAIVIDSIVLSLLTLLVNAVFGVTHITSGSPLIGESGSGVFATSTDVGWGWLTLIWLIYYIGLEALFGATVGKWMLGLRVITLAGTLPRLRAVVERSAMRFVDSLPIGFLLGGLVALNSPYRQRLGDRLAHTLVVHREALAAPLLTPTLLRRRLALVGGALVACLTLSSAFFYYGRPPLVVQSAMNTRAMMFEAGVSSYTLSAPVWGAGTVTYQITYVTEQPVNTCHARLTLAWAFPSGWEPRYGESTCGK